MYGNGGSYGASTSPVGGPVQTARESLTSRLDSHSSALHSAISELEQRLAAVLSVAPPAADSPKDRQAGAPLGELVDRVQFALVRLHALMSRIEI